MPPSSRGLGQLPFTEQTGIRIPLGVTSTLLFFNFIATKYIENLTNYCLKDDHKNILKDLSKTNLCYIYLDFYFF